MTATLPDITLNTRWQDVHALSGAPPGTKIGIQNKSWVETMLVCQSATKPAEGANIGVTLPPLPGLGAYAEIEADAINKTWARLIRGDGQASVVL